MNDTETAEILLRLHDGWPEPWPAATVDVWTPLVAELPYVDTYEAVTELFRISERRPTFAMLRARIEIIQNRRLPARTGPPCIRCDDVPAEQGRSRCSPCQIIVDDETARGVHDRAMVDAVAAARRRPV